MTNREIAQEISNRIGTAPVPFDSVYSMALQIYHELGGEENQFDSVYSILLEILPLVEGGINPIKEVNVLPEASENKDKFFRLDNGDKDVYAAKLLSSKTITTNRLPDEQQIDKAYLYDTDNNFVFYYKGIWKIICTNGEISLYCWVDDFENDRAYFTYDNAENINHNSETLSFSDTVYDSVDANTKTIIDGETLEELKSHFSVHNFINPIPAIYNAPESAQIGNATLVDENSTIQHIYTGEEIIITVDGNETVVYKWQNTEFPNDYVATNKKASEIYYTGGYPNLITDVKIYDLNISPVQQTTIYELNIPQLNAPDSEQVGNATIKYNMGGNIFTATYDGTLTTLYDSIKDVSFTGYKWTTNSDVLITTVKAEELYSNAGTFSFMRQNGSEVADVKEGVTEVNTAKYQRTKTTEIWDWKALTNDWAVGAIYRYYNQEVTGVAGISYDSQDWLTAILKYTMKNYTKECLQELITKGYGATTHLMVHLKYWHPTVSKWYDDLIDISVSNAVGSSLISLETFNTYIANILNVKANNYDAHNYIYVTNIGIYIPSNCWNIDNMSFAMDEFSDAIAFPINTAIRPDYIETYPEKNE